MKRQLRKNIQSLAKKYRPRKPKTLAMLISVLAERQEFTNALLQLHPYNLHHIPGPSLTYSGLLQTKGLTRKQIKDGIDTLKTAGLISFIRQHNGTRGFGRVFYDCKLLLQELNYPGSVLGQKTPSHNDFFEVSKGGDTESGDNQDFEPYLHIQHREAEEQERAEVERDASFMNYVKELFSWNPAEAYEPIPEEFLIEQPEHTKPIEEIGERGPNDSYEYNLLLSKTRCIH